MCFKFRLGVLKRESANWKKHEFSEPTKINLLYFIAIQPEHRPSVLSFQWCRYIASSWNSAKDFPHSAKTMAIPPIQVALGRPCDLFPYRFHFCSVLFTNLLVGKARNFCLIFSVTNQVSQPYSRTYLTQTLNSLILRCRFMFLALQIFFCLENASIVLLFTGILK
jgi:hypothetical protein